jgi:hypothetical protein
MLPVTQTAPSFANIFQTNSCCLPAGSHVDYLPSLSPSGFYNSLMTSKTQLHEPLLFNGLRVRMGVVTGDVPSGTPIKNSALFALAKGVVHSSGTALAEWRCAHAVFSRSPYENIILPARVGCLLFCEGLL